MLKSDPLHWISASTGLADSKGPPDAGMFGAVYILYLIRSPWGQYKLKTEWKDRSLEEIFILGIHLKLSDLWSWELGGGVGDGRSPKTRGRRDFTFWRYRQELVSC